MSSTRREVIAGLIAAIVAVPQCVALGVAAFGPLARDYPALAQVAGFYSAIIVGLFVSLGGRGQISLTGPRVGSATVLAGTAVALLAANPVGVSSTEVLGILLLVMIAAGLLQWCMGVAQLASLQSYIARPVIVGLMTGVAATMLFAQCREVLRGQPLAAAISMATFGVAVTIWGLGKFADIAFLRKHRWLTSWGMVFATCVGIGLYFALPEGLGDKGGTLAAIERFWVVPEVFGAILAAGPVILTRADVMWSMVPAVLMLAVVGSLDTTNSHVATRQKLLKGGLTRRQREVVSSDNENSELYWHGLGNAVAPIFGGIPSSASDARAEAALAADGGTWVGGSAYVMALSMLMVANAWVPWTTYFPKAVVIGLMMHIAVLLLSSQLSDLKRYGRALTLSLRNLAIRKRATRAPGQSTLETVMNGVTVLVVGISLYEFDPMRAVASGMLCSMLIFLIKIGQSQRHRCYLASERVSLQQRPRAEAAIASEARSRCQIIKLHGDFFFLSHKKAMKLVDEVRSRSSARGQPGSHGRYVIIDFDMAHEFDESGIHEIKLMIERLQECSFTVLLSYVSLKSGLAQLLRFDHVIEGRPLDRVKALVSAHHIFDTTERAINYVEDQAVLEEKSAIGAVQPWPVELASLATLPSRRFEQAAGNERFWIVRRGQVTLRHRVSQTVSEFSWNKVIAEVGSGGVISGKTLDVDSVEVEMDAECDLTSIDDEWISREIEHRPADAARMLAYFADYIASLNSMLQTEAAMLDY